MKDGGRSERREGKRREGGTEKEEEKRVDGEEERERRRRVYVQQNINTELPMIIVGVGNKKRVHEMMRGQAFGRMHEKILFLAKLHLLSSFRFEGLILYSRSALNFVLSYTTIRPFVCDLNYSDFFLLLNEAV